MLKTITLSSSPSHRPLALALIAALALAFTSDAHAQDESSDAAPETVVEEASATTSDDSSPETAPTASEDAPPASITPDSTPEAPVPSESQPATITSSAPATPSQNVTINLINRLVAKGLLTQEDAADLVAQAEADAALARQQNAAIESAVLQIAAAQALPPEAYLRSPQVDPGITPYPEPDDTLSVSYIPETVKEQIRNDLRAEVLAQARDENWANPRLYPEWLTRLRLFGDLRVRYQGDYFPGGNDNTGAFPNFNAINTGAPFDVAGTVFSPQYNVDQNRSSVRLRLRLGAEVTLRDGFSGGIRIVTGNNNSPVSANQTFGNAGSGQGGNFSKYAIWLDRAFLRYDFTEVANLKLSALVGRFENPFFSTPVLWDDDIGFDGFAFKGSYKIQDFLTPFLTAGAFPIFNTDFNYSSNQPAKFDSQDKWLYAVQAGLEWKIADDWNTKFAFAYYHFDGVEGQLSDPFVPLTITDQGNTDATRPAFAQKGNTYRALRNITPTAANEFGTRNQFQYFGLASKFRQIALTGALSYTGYEPVQVTLSGEYVKNTAFDRNEIDSFAVNNRGPSPTGPGAFDGGDTAWQLGLRFGSAQFEKRGDWNVNLIYRYVESDAVIDGFTDSNLGLGGTNLEGYVLSGQLAISPDVVFGVRWLSANEIAGPPLKSDTLQLDISTKF